MGELNSIAEPLTPQAVQKFSKTPQSPEFQLFAKRRAYIEQEGLRLPRHSERFDVEGGGVVRVIWSLIDLEKVNKEAGASTLPAKDRKTLYVSVMNAGQFLATDMPRMGEGTANTGNTEIKLAAGLFAGQDGFVPDAVIFVKSEGLNAEAYAKGNTLMGEATARQLAILAENYKKAHGFSDDCEVIFDLTGYSQGGTRIVSTAAAIDRNHCGTIRRVLSIGGAGFVGTQQGETANPFAFVTQALREAQAAKKNFPKYGALDRGTSGIRRDGEVVVPDIHVSSRPIEALRRRLTKYPEHYIPLSIQRGGWGTERIVPMHDVQNIVGYGWELLHTYVRENPLVKKAFGPMDLGKAIHWREIQESCVLNEDREYLAKRGIKTMIFTDYDDPFFPPRLIQKDINGLRDKYPNANMWFIASRLGHAGPHYEQTAFNWLCTTLMRAWEERST